MNRCTLKEAESIAYDMDVRYFETEEGVLIGNEFVPFIERTKELEFNAIDIAMDNILADAILKLKSSHI
jgi:hypothetical protein